MNRNNTGPKPGDERTRERDTRERDGISPLNPSTFPRAEDDEETFARSPEFHDLPDPGPNVGRFGGRHSTGRNDTGNAGITMGEVRGDREVALPLTRIRSMP
jgi:hypothetical protein